MNQMQLLLVESFTRISMRQVIFLKIHDVIIRPFPFKCFSTSYVFPFDFLLSLIQLLLKFAISPYISGCLKRKPVSGILPLANHLRLWGTLFDLERVQYKALYVRLAQKFGGYCNHYICQSVRRNFCCELQMSSMIFVKCLFALKA